MFLHLHASAIASPPPVFPTAIAAALLHALRLPLGWLFGYRSVAHRRRVRIVGPGLLMRGRIPVQANRGAPTGSI